MLQNTLLSILNPEDLGKSLFLWYFLHPIKTKKKSISDHLFCNWWNDYQIHFEIKFLQVSTLTNNSIFKIINRLKLTCVYVSSSNIFCGFFFCTTVIELAGTTVSESFFTTAIRSYYIIKPNNLRCVFHNFCHPRRLINNTSMLIESISISWF